MKLTGDGGTSDSGLEKGGLEAAAHMARVCFWNGPAMDPLTRLLRLLWHHVSPAPISFLHADLLTRAISSSQLRCHPLCPLPNVVLSLYHPTLFYLYSLLKLPLICVCSSIFCLSLSPWNTSSMRAAVELPFPSSCCPVLCYVPSANDSTSVELVLTKYL